MLLLMVMTTTTTMTTTTMTTMMMMVLVLMMVAMIKRLLMMMVDDWVPMIDDDDADDDDDNMYGFYCVLAMYIGSRSSEGILGGLLQANTCTKEHILWWFRVFVQIDYMRAKLALWHLSEFRVDLSACNLLFNIKALPYSYVLMLFNTPVHMWLPIAARMHFRGFEVLQAHASSNLQQACGPNHTWKLWKFIPSRALHFGTRQHMHSFSHAIIGSAQVAVGITIYQ